MHTSSCTEYPVPDDAAEAESRAKTTNRYRNRCVHKYHKQPQRQTFCPEGGIIHAIQLHRPGSYTRDVYAVLWENYASARTSNAKNTSPGYKPFFCQNRH